MGEYSQKLWGTPSLALPGAGSSVLVGGKRMVVLIGPDTQDCLDFPGFGRVHGDEQFLARVDQPNSVAGEQPRNSAGGIKYSVKA